MVLLLVFMQLTRYLFAIGEFLFISAVVNAIVLPPFSIAPEKYCSPRYPSKPPGKANMDNIG